MANMTIQNPGLGRLFSGLSQALGGGDAESLIRADLAKTQRDNTLSETAINGATLGTLQRQENAMKSLADVLSNPDLTTTPAGRASLAAVLSQVPDGLEIGNKYALGTTAYINPETFNEKQLSDVAFATGAAPDYASTPSGLSQTLAGEMDRAVLQEQGALVRDGGGLLPTVGIADADDFAASVDAALEARFGSTPVSPGLRDQISAHATRLFQQTRNAPASIQQAMQDFNLVDTTRIEPDPLGIVLGNLPLGFGPALSGLGLANPLKVVRGRVTPTAPAALPPSIAPPEGATPGAIPPDQLPPSLRNVTQAPDGSFVWTGPNGQQMPLEEGQTFYSPTSGVRIMWQGGQWVQV